MRRLGPYLLAARLSRGEAADVHLSRRDDAPDPVALKVFGAEWSENLNFTRDLFREAKRASSLPGPTLVPVADAGRADGQTFVATELVAGQPLFALLKKARLADAALSVDVVLGAFVDLFEGLQAAHTPRDGRQDGYVHGRLGPRDVYVTYQGELRLLGFGLGRARQRLPFSFSRLPYVAPEVLQGRPIQPEADLFSACALLYEALSGRSPFRRSTEEATRKALQRGDLVPLKVRETPVKPALVDWLNESLVPKPKARPATAASGLEVLQRDLKSGRGEYRAVLARAMEQHFAEEADGLRRMLQALGLAWEETRGQGGDRPVGPPSPEPEAGWVPQTHDLLLDGEAVDPSGPSRPVPDLGEGGFDGGFSGKSDVPWASDAQRLDGGTGDTGSLDPRSAGTPDLDRSLERNPVPGSPAEARIARYRLKQCIQMEGPVQVWTAVDPNLSRRVTVKVLDPSVADPSVDAETRIKLFKREARYATRLWSRRFPTLLDAGRAGDLYFAVYETRPGLPLLEHLAEGRPVDELFLLDQLAEGLQFLHQAGFTYGPIRARHVRLFRQEGEFASVSTVNPQQRGCHPLIPVQDPAVPPEFSQSRSWDVRSDQHQLGVFAYQLWSGTDSEDGAPCSAWKPLHQLGLGIDPELSEVVARAMAVDPGQRFDDLQEFRDRLAAMLRRSQDGRNAAAGLQEEPSPEPDPLSLCRAYSNLARRAIALAAEDQGAEFKHPGDAARLVGAVARRLRWPAPRVQRSVVAASARALSRRTRLPLSSDAFEEIVPEPALRLIRSIDANRPASIQLDPDDGARALVMLAEAFVEQVQLDRVGRHPLRHLDAIAGSFPPDLVRALKATLRESIDRPEPDQSAGPTPRILLAGAVGLSAALEAAGFEVVQAADGHETWELMRQMEVDGLVVQADLPGRDGLSVVRLCTHHPDLKDVPVWLVDTGLQESERRLASEWGAVVVAGASGSDILRALILRRFGKTNGTERESNPPGSQAP